MSRLHFQLEAVAAGSRARAARFRTLHGEITTPLFMPVGTQATVRAQNHQTLTRTGAQILLANTYHLMLRPGEEVFRRFGGIHRFMSWDRSVLTDSGGYQVFSLPHAREVAEEGASFRSYVDGTRILLSPERSIGMQRAIGSDIMMAFDQCIPSTSGREEARAAMELTHRWARRSLDARGDSPQALFGIVQGACFPDLRKASADFLTALPFDGFAIGGLAVGEGREQREAMTELTAELLPRELPRYLMGVGTPIDLLEAVHRGVDLFDCILPTALAQQGVAFTAQGRLELRRGVYKLSDDPLAPGCECETCGSYSRGYLHHLVKTREILGWHLIGAHNLHFYRELMDGIRASILEDRFVELYREKREELARGDDLNPKRTAKPPRARIGGRAPRLGAFELVRAEAGFWSMKQTSSGEVMHSVSEPGDEARRLYIEQSRLERRLAPGSELVIWDVGLGAGTNAMEGIRACERAGARDVSVRIVSFERDLDALRLALRHQGLFPSLWHPAPGILLERGEWRSERLPLHWTLLEGDFLDRLGEAPPAELVFFDPFSYRSDSPLWEPACFAKILDRCGDRAVELYTYSASTAVRAALFSAGFFVARGVGTGPKAETTIALSPSAVARADHGFELLGAEWLARFERSGARTDALAGGVRAHPQFSYS